ncbi:MAG TPA: alpha-amylase family glycosyl hydrolase [Luteolibacter sp.]|nr:alpha-amylase family glycosyl hydrolase [Luteolibacter sp.]
MSVKRDGARQSQTRPVIYQLLVRTFGNHHPDFTPNGTIGQNGCGKFADINDRALVSLAEMGFTHLWLTGVLEQATTSAYPGIPADDPLVVKGRAGSPYAIKDCFDVSPDYAVVPARRLQEFGELLTRCKKHGLRVLMDFVPNHVARSHRSDQRPDLDFGKGDDPTKFFARDNHFFYLQPHHSGGGPPLRLPRPDGGPLAYAPEARCGKVTGNNAITWTPSLHDWFETVKLNYGHDFTHGRDTSHLPGPNAPASDVPRTWRTLNDVLAHWQNLGVAGFRCDMAHMVPLEFWRWIIRRCRERDPECLFIAEAYDNDPAKLCDGNVLDELLRAGFDAVYDDPIYDILEGILDDGKWANDLDILTFTGARFHRSLRYAENHDEVRIANPGVWGGHGMKIGKPVTALLFGMGSGPLMIYHGQEVGEAALEPWGYGGHNGRTSIFDYGRLPELSKWYHDGLCDGAMLSDEQRQLREWYGKLIHALKARAFTRGCFYGLNHANKHNEAYGRLDGEDVSGHWLYSYLRRDSQSGSAYLVVVNLHPDRLMQGVRIRIPADARMFIGSSSAPRWTFTDRLLGEWKSEVVPGDLEQQGLALPDLEPCSAMVLEIGKK